MSGTPRLRVVAAQTPRVLAATTVLIALLASGAPAGAQTASEPEARGDSLMRAFDTSAAIEAYRRGLAGDPTDVALLWKTSRAISNLADETPGEEGDEARYEEAVELARRAVRAGPDVARAHTTLAAALGKLALYRGGKRKVERAFFGGLPDASLERSRRLLERAVSLAPETVTPHLELARTLVEMDETAAARRHLRTAASLQPRERLDQVQQRRVRELLEELGG